jgi:acyl-CoA synthetase (AMP-forming)/AMP-acid ligase II/3-hydroxymyristoyl/3-hydroxydecanoyl-(acyl carrier protein) dehydratase
MVGSILHRDGAPELLEQAHRVAAALGTPTGRVVLSCKHADAFMPGLLGAWLAGATVELLPNVQPGTLDRVDTDPEITFVLHDGVAQQERSPKALFVPELLKHPTAVRASGWPTIAALMSTSGTTERPRYVAKTMQQLVDELDVLASVIPQARCVMSTVPLSHLYGMLFGALLPLRFGARIVSHEALLPADVAAVIQREGVDLMVSTPAHLRAMANAPMPRNLRVLSSGARMPPELHMSLATGHNWQVTEILGSTETGGIATRGHPLHGFTPLPRVTVTAPEGQLVVESPWCGEPRVVLEDRIELASDGTFRYLGRANELIKVAGKRAHAHELEATILKIPGITDAALMVHAVAGKEPRVAVAVTVAEGSTVGRTEIAAAIREQFDAVFVPKIIKIVPRIPRTERGKLDSNTLRALLGVETTATTAEIPIRRVGPNHYIAEIPQNLVFFHGHFDDFTILPGAVLVERVVWPVVKAELPEVRALRGIRRLRFRRPVMPDQHLDVTLDRRNNRLTFTVTCAESPVASGVLLVE